MSKSISVQFLVASSLLVFMMVMTFAALPAPSMIAAITFTPAPTSAVTLTTPPQRPSPYPTATLSEALILFTKNTVVFAAPDNTADILLSAIPQNAFARLLAVTQDRRWYQIEIGNTIGWIFSATASIVGQPSGLYQIIAQTPSPTVLGITPTVEPIATQRMVGAYPTIRFDEHIEVYAGADAFYPRIGRIVSGQVAEILATASGRGREWYLIRYANGAGWTSHLTGEIQGDLSVLPHLESPETPDTNLNSLQYPAPHDLDPLLSSPTPVPEIPMNPTLAAMPGLVAKSIEMILEPDLPSGAYTTEQLFMAAAVIRTRLEQYPITNYTIEIEETTNTIRVHFPDNLYRDELLVMIPQEGLFEAVDFRDQSLELRSALLNDTILTSGYRSRENERIRLLNETYNISNSDELAAVGFTFSTRRRNPVERNQAFQTVFDNEAIAGASLAPGFGWDVVVTLTDTGMERFSGYPGDRLIAFTLDGRVLAVPLASNIRQTFTLDVHYMEQEARPLVVLLRSGSLPFALRPLQVTYYN